MTDKSTIQQVLGCLIQRPVLLGEVDKYNLGLMDFSSRFERYIFSAIDGLYKQGASHIDPIDIANFLEASAEAKKCFDNSNGIEYIQDICEFSSVDNFAYYYNKLKKLNLLRDLKRQGIDVSEFYQEDLTNPRADEINGRFEQLTTQEICENVKRKVAHLETEYVKTGEVEVEDACEGIDELFEELNNTVSIGLPIQGHIYNKIFSGSEKGALYIRSGGSGVGKTRQSVGDACYLAYPVRYNSMTGQWEQRGSNEKVLFIITEQTKAQIRKMIVAYLADINDSRFKLGNFTPEEQDRIDKAKEIMKQYNNMTIIKMPSPTIELVKTMVREQCMLKDIGYVFYDYIFIGPSLLNEFKGFSLRNDEVLLMFAAALKDLAVELNVAMFTSTQVNAKADDNKEIRNEASLAGGRATINKADNGAIISRPTNEELETLQNITDKCGVPNIVTDIFKCRSGEYTQVRVWSIVNLGTLRKKDLFITDSRLDPIEGFFEDEMYEIHNWEDEEICEIGKYVDELNATAVHGSKILTIAGLI